MNLTRVTIHDRDEWNNLLKQMPYAHILQSWEWGQFKYETTGWIAHRWVFKDGDTIIAACSMGEKRFGLFSMMYAPKGPAMDYSKPQHVTAVLDALQQIAREYRAIWLKIDPDFNLATGVPHAEDDMPYLPGVALKKALLDRGWFFSDDQVQFRNTITLDLTRTEDELLADMSQNTRRKVRTAEKKDVSIRVGTLDDLDMLYQLYVSTGERNEFLVRPREYYTKLWRYFIENKLAHVLIAEFEGKPIAQVILFHFAKTCWYFYGASSSEERNRMPTYALQWEAIKWAKTQGYTIYDFWGAPNEFIETDSMWGVYEFKRGFRGQVERRLGAWDYTPSPLAYRMVTQGWHYLRELIRRLRTW